MRRGGSGGTLRRWRRSPPPARRYRPTAPPRRRLAEADRLHRALSSVIRPDALGPWLNAPNDAFGGLKPLELIERGETGRLWQMLFDLCSGNPA